MKCVKLNEMDDKPVVRMSNEEAAELVASEKAAYSKKEAWKAQGRRYAYMGGQPRSVVINKVVISKKGKINGG